ncbi:MAG: hypothetical protein K2W93_05580, partial [Burkholderiaceae bacterium]|nr:hypothetical protein [Burkholderiaceae bacterium]
MNPQQEASPSATPVPALRTRLHRIYAWYTLGFVVFVLGLAVCEYLGMPKIWIGFCFLAATVGIYAVIGLFS